VGVVMLNLVYWIGLMHSCTLKLKGSLVVQRCKKIDQLRAVNGIPPYAPVSNRSLLSPVTLPIIRDANIKNDTRLRIFSGTANPSLSQVS
jgi:hypothetical protein